MIFTYGYLFYIPITLFFLMLFIFIGKKNKEKIFFYICAVIAVVYINFAIKLSMFPILIEDIPEFDISYNINWSSLNLISCWKHNLLNMLLTFPIGFGMPFLLKKSFRKNIIVAVLCGMCFELCQLLILYVLKPINIFFDINDLISNVLGVLIGSLVIYIIKFAIKNEGRSL